MVYCDTYNSSVDRAPNQNKALSSSTFKHLKFIG